MSTDSLASNIVDFSTHKVKGFEQPNIVKEANAVQDEVILECLDSGEAGDAILFAHLYYNKLIYDPLNGAWYAWRNGRWEREHNARQLVLTELPVVYRGAADRLRGSDPRGSDLQKALALTRKAKSLCNLIRANHVITLAQPLLTIGGEWDANPWLLGVNNGVIDLQTGDFRPYRPEDYIRTIAPVDWLGIDTPAPLWESFLQEIFSDEPDREEFILFLRRLLGYGITGDTKGHYCPIFLGSGRNGKGIMLRTINRALGAGLADTVSRDVIMAPGRGRSQGAAQSYLMKLRGKRLAWVVESEEGGRINAETFKAVTGGDNISAREQYEKEGESFRPSHMLILVTNYWPGILHGDLASWDRVFPIYFSRRYVENPSRRNEYPQDTTLEDRLQSELSGILAWLVRGSVDYWQERGLNTPDCVTLKKEEYQRQTDTAYLFMEECLDFDESLRVKAALLFQAYLKWCELTKRKADLNETTFGKRITAHLVEMSGHTADEVKKRQGRGVFYLGVGLRIG